MYKEKKLFVRKTKKYTLLPLVWYHMFDVEKAPSHSNADDVQNKEVDEMLQNVVKFLERVRNDKSLLWKISQRN